LNLPGQAKYLGYGFDELDKRCLCHGDCHAGSVMVQGGSVKVIDPEFTVYGPPGLDLGSLFSGFILAFIYHKLGLGSTGDIEPSAAAPDLLEALRLIWDRYENVLLEEGVDAAQVARIGEDAVGFAMMEVVRTSLGFAGARDPHRRIKDETTLNRFQSLAVGLARQCLKRRRSGGPSMLFEQLEMHGQAAEGWKLARDRSAQKVKRA